MAQGYESGSTNKVNTIFCWRSKNVSYLERRSQRQYSSFSRSSAVLGFPKTRFRKRRAPDCAAAAVPAAKLRCRDPRSRRAVIAPRHDSAALLQRRRGAGRRRPYRAYSLGPEEIADAEAPVARAAGVAYRGAPGAAAG